MTFKIFFGNPAAGAVEGVGQGNAAGLGAASAVGTGIVSAVGLTTDAFNPADAHSRVTLGNGNLTASKNVGGATYAAVRSAGSHATGKLYFEGRLDAVSVSDDELAILGLSTATGALNNRLGSGTGADWSAGFFCWGSVWQNATGSWSATGKPIGVGEWAGLAVDFDAGKAWVRDSTGWDGDPEAGAGNVISFTPNLRLHAATQLYSTTPPGPDQITANFGATAFNYTIPSGFEKWAAAGVAFAVGEFIAISAADGAAAGTGTASAASAVTAAAVGSASGIGVASAAGAATDAAIGSATGTGAAAGTASVTVAATASASGTGAASATGDSFGEGAGAGSADGVGTATAVGVAIGEPQVPVFGGGGILQLPRRPFPVVGEGYGILPRLWGEAHGVVGVESEAAAALAGFVGRAAGSFEPSTGVRSASLRPDIEAKALGHCGQRGIAAATLKRVAASGSGTAGTGGAGSGVIVELKGTAVGHHHDDEGAIVAWLLAA